MRRINALLVLLFTSTLSFSQDAIVRKLQAESLRPVKKDVSDTSWKTWKKGGVYSISIGQGSLSNWSAGGDDFSLTVATSVNLFSFYKKDKHSWDNTLDVNFGYVNTTSLGSRKNDDRFDLLTKYGFSLNKKLNVATLGNLRSQFFAGYTYGDGTKKLVSSFFSPANIIVSQGLDYKPSKNLSIFVSPITSRWVIVRDDSIAIKGDYIVPGKKSTNQLGSFATVNYYTALNKYVTYKGRIDLFSNYKKNPLNADVYMTNSLSAKVGKIVAFSWNLDMIYDDDVRMFGKTKESPALQVKSLIGVGLQVKI